MTRARLVQLFGEPDPSAPVVVLTTGTVPRRQRRALAERLRRLFAAHDRGDALRASVDLALLATTAAGDRRCTIVARGAGDRPFVCAVRSDVTPGVYVGVELPTWLTQLDAQTLAA